MRKALTTCTVCLAGLLGFGNSIVRGESPVTYRMLKSLQETTDYAGIRDLLQDRDWKESGKELQGDLNIVTWQQGSADKQIIIEHGPGYSTSVVYRTASKQRFLEVLNQIDWDSVEQQYHRSGSGLVSEAYTMKGSENVILLAKPEAANRTEHTLIVTTIDNIDALWFESTYLK